MAWNPDTYGWGVPRTTTTTTTTTAPKAPSTSWGIPYDPATGDYDPGGDYATGGGGDDDPDNNNPDDPDTPDEDNETEDTDEPTEGQRDAYDIIYAELSAWFDASTAASLAKWAWDRIVDGAGQAEILAELRKRPEYGTRFSGNILRQANGLPWMSEAQYLAQETEAKRIAQALGFAIPSNELIAKGIGNGRSLAELEHSMLVWQRAQDFGQATQDFFANRLGLKMTDEDLYSFFDPTISTPEWDDALAEARLAGQPVLLGFNLRGQREIDLLRAMGVTPERQMDLVRNAAMDIPRIQRLASISNNIVSGLPADFGGFMKDIPNELIYAAHVMMDPAAQAAVQALTAQEIGRNSTGGGAANAGTKTLGLLTEGERAAL